MKRFHQLHECAPPEWRKTELITGDYDFDAAIGRHANDKVLMAKVHSSTGHGAYGPRTAYNGYNTYTGDE